MADDECKGDDKHSAADKHNAADKVFSLFFECERHPFTFKNIKVNEKIVPSRMWSDGVFPGMKIEGDIQTATVKCFQNLIEYTRVVESESVVEDGKRYLLSSFFVNRKLGWEAEEFIPKKGKTVGFYLNGHIYSAESKTRVLTVLYQVHYVDVIRREPFFQDAIQMVKSGVDVRVRGLETVNFPRLTSLLYLALQDL